MKYAVIGRFASGPGLGRGSTRKTDQIPAKTGAVWPSASTCEFRMKAGMIILILVICLLYLASVIQIAIAVYAAVRSNAAAHWPTAPASIVNLDFHTGSDYDGDTTYEVKVAYTYTVAGVDYKGSTIAYDYRANGGMATHKGIHERLRLSRSVQVRYDPADPELSTLSYGMHSPIRVRLVFAFGLLAFAIFVSVLCWVAAGKDDLLMKNLLVE